MPKQAFILWMACKGELLTKVELRNWGCIYDDSCILCGNGGEDEQHLFFQCKFTKKIWEEVKRRNGISRSNGSWVEELSNAIKEGEGDTFVARIRCLSWAAMVYFIWQERNARTFKDERQLGICHR